MIWEVGLYIIAIVTGTALFGLPFLLTVLVTVCVVLLSSTVAGYIIAPSRTVIRQRQVFGRTFSYPTRVYRSNYIWMYGPTQWVRDDNRIWALWGVVTLVASFLAIFIHGPGSSPVEQLVYEARQDPFVQRMTDDRKRFYEIAQTGVIPEVSPRDTTEPTEEKPPTWAPWWMAAYCWAVLVIMFFPTFADEGRRSFRRAWRGAWERLGGEASTAPGFFAALSRSLRGRPRAPAAPAEQPAGHAQAHSWSPFWSSFFANLLAEFPELLHSIWRTAR